MKGDEERIRGKGCEAYLSKPISVAKFLDTVRNYLGDALSSRRLGSHQFEKQWRSFALVTRIP